MFFEVPKGVIEAMGRQGDLSGAASLSFRQGRYPQA
jgi:hypothetical protein